ncbi:MAG: hypothetical protein MRK01_09405 [Candidatus Scalindua sp.]|nr:hypothetical protein [Candidatus Scalindua sp.]
MKIYLPITDQKRRECFLRPPGREVLTGAGPLMRTAMVKPFTVQIVWKTSPAIQRKGRIDTY